MALLSSFLRTSFDLKHFLSTAGLLACLFLVTVISILVVRSKRAGLSHLPGPWLAQYTDAWNVYATYRANHGKDKVAFHRHLQTQYGNVVRTGPTCVTVLDPAAVPVIYGVRSRLNKGDAYIPFRRSGVMTALLSIQEESLHARYRKLVANAYVMTSLKEYEPYVEEVVARFVQVCDHHVETGQPLNLGLWSHYYCFDLICKLTMGKTLGFMDGNGQDVFAFIKNIHEYLKYVTYVNHMPWLHRIFVENMVMRRAKPSPFLKVVRSAIVSRLQKPDVENGSRPDLLAHFIASHERTPELMTEDQIAISATSNLVAGGLSPARAFNELWRYLADHPESQNRLYEELVAANVTMPAAPFDEVKDLPYLKGLILEAYRTHTNTTFNLQRVTGPAGLDLPSGHHIPAATNIGCPPGMMNRNTSIYGSDADMYVPERWMKAAGESTEAFDQRVKLMDRTDLTFGHGTRTCIGKNIVALEFFKAVAPLVCLFEFAPVGIPKGSEVLVSVRRRHGQRSEVEK